MALVMKVGGASGPLYGTLFMALGKELPAEPDARRPGRRFGAAVEAVKARGKSEVGQKTHARRAGAGRRRRSPAGRDPTRRWRDRRRRRRRQCR